MHALRNIHATLAPDALLVDTQPLSPHPRVATDGGADLGALDMRRWADTIDAVDGRIAEAMAARLYELRHEQRFTVTDSFDNGSECLETARTWRDTKVPPSLAARLETTRDVVSVEQEIRLRLLRRLTPTPS